MVEREVAHRIFAQEFNDSRFQIYSSKKAIPDEQEIYSPNFLITPTGLKVNRLFIVGVVTEVERLTDQRSDEKELWRARVSDPTGTFNIYAGSYQPEAAVFLSAVNVPSYIMVLGKVRSYEPGDGSVYVSLRPEEMNYVDETIRDRWIVDTAEMTLNRLKDFEKYFQLENRDENIPQSISSCDIAEELEDRMALSLEYYKKDKDYYASLKAYTKRALCSIRPSNRHITEEKDYENSIMALLEEMGSGNAFSYKEYTKQTSSMGIPDELAEQILRSLLSKGHIYEPRSGYFKLIS